MTNKTLRALAKDYAQGVTDRDTYRKARSELIEGIIAGKIKVEPIDFPPPIDLDDGDPTVESAITQINPEQFTKKPAQPQSTPTPPPPPPPAKETHHHWLIGSGIVALLCLIILVFLFIGKKDKVKEKETSYDYEFSELTVKDATTTSDKSAADYLIEGFLKQNNWNDEYTRQFINNWNNLSIQEQTTALNSTAISRLSNAIYKQLLNERALLGLGNDAEVVAKQQALVDFANKLGIDDSRLIVKGKVEDSDTENTESKENDMPAKDQPSDIIDEADSTIDPDSAVIPPEEAIRASPVNEEQDIISQQSTTPEILSKTTAEKIPEVETTTTSESKENTATKQQSTSNKNACRAELARERKPYCRDVINGIGNGPTLVAIRSGKFKMGGQNPSELPIHEVTIGNPFALSVNEITFGEYKLFCKDSQYSCPEQPWVGEDYPVVNVSWPDAQAYVKWLTEKTGNTYRLPSEAEWEYSARAGTTTVYPFGDEILITDAVFSDRKQLSSPLPKTDRSINRNKFRLYHMMGNVREWVADNWQENYSSVSNDGTAFENGSEMRVVRGGSFNDTADALRSGARDKLSADTRDKFTGFRVLQELK